MLYISGEPRSLPITEQRKKKNIALQVGNTKESTVFITRNPTRNIKETITALPTPKIISFPFMKMKTS